MSFTVSQEHSWGSDYPKSSKSASYSLVKPTAGGFSKVRYRECDRMARVAATRPMLYLSRRKDSPSPRAIVPAVAW